MDTIKTGEIREKAKALSREQNNLAVQCKECDTLIRQLNHVFHSTVYDTFVQRYQSYRPTMESLCECLEQYAKFLDSVADNYDTLIRDAIKKLQ